MQLYLYLFMLFCFGLYLLYNVTLERCGYNIYNYVLTACISSVKTNSFFIRHGLHDLVRLF